MFLAAILAASLTAAADIPDDARPPPSEAQSTEISVLTYNVKGLPWPLASGRAEALREIGRELAQMRQEGRQPDVVLIQEGFRGEVADLVRASGYRFWARGPSRSEGSQGERWTKLTGAGLHVLSDAPITDVSHAAYRDCAGLDCLANKGVMLARLALPGAPVEVDIVNTHLNSKRASRAPLAQSLKAHNRQTEALIAFIRDNRAPDAPLLVGGDFNVKGAPDRYDHFAAARPYRVVSEYCSAPASACEGQASASAQPWLRSQDLQAFTDGGPVAVRPVKVETVFAGPGRLSDHDGYLVRYRLSWTPQTAPARPRNPLAVRPAGRGLKVSWTY